MKNIALAVGYLDNEFSMAIIDGAWTAAQKLGVNLFIFPTRLIVENYNDLELNRYTYQYNTMLSYLGKGNFDGIIMETAVICNGLSDEKIKELYSSFGVPIVSLSRKTEGYPNVCFNSVGLAMEIQHLIDEHSCTKIGFVGGPHDNREANDRFRLYKETLEKNGIPYDEKLYVESDFSEFCEEKVKQLINRNEGKLDAICFANDRMAIGGYKVMNELGIVPGKDIYVTGFDDAPSASAMNPPLTTVHSNTQLIGYNAVKLCADILDGKDVDDVFVDTSMIIRSSCGCPSRISMVIKSITDQGSLELVSPDIVREKIEEFMFGATNYDDETKEQVNDILDSLCEMLKKVTEPGFSSKYYIDKLYNKIKHVDFEVVSYGDLSFVLSLVRKKALATAHDKIEAEDVFYGILDKIAEKEFFDIYALRQNFRETSRISSFLINDVLANINDEELSYRAITSNLRRKNANSSYLFMHEIPVISQNSSVWFRPRTEKLVCYQIGDRNEIVPAECQNYSSEAVFRCDVITDRPHVFIVNPLFHNEEHYGLLFVETDKKEYAHFEWSVANQVDNALRMKRLMEEQISVQKQLSKNMEMIESYNKLLHHKSVSDELTGIHNRRGYIEAVTGALTDPKNFGKNAAICFVDMNYLKVVNDRFGHDDGDFALKGVAQILTSCFRSSDIVARFGGDEFATFGFIRGNDFGSLLRRRIKEATDDFNARSGKDFLVTISVGIYEFQCNASTNLTECMNKADALLYQDKQNKPKSTIRGE